MNRRIINAGAQPQDVDLAYAQQGAMVNEGFLAEAFAGSSAWAYGLACTPTSPPSMTLNVGRGCLGQMSVVDQTNPGTAAIANATDALMKVGINLESTSLPFTAPGASGDSQCFLIQGQMQETDGGATVLPYYNADEPSEPFSGPGNTGAATNTIRYQTVALQTKAGAPAPTGSQTAPGADTGWVPLWVITIPNGATSLTSANIAVASGAPFLPSLRQLSISTNFIPFTSSGTYTPSPGLLYADLEGVGAGGGGANSSGGSAPSASAGNGGGGAGYFQKRWTPQQIGTSAAIVIGAAGGAQTNGGNTTVTPSGTGTPLSATGGAGASVGDIPHSITTRGSGLIGAGGTATGGDINLPGGAGSFGIAFGDSSLAASGKGGDSQLGFGGQPSEEQNSGNVGVGYGAGGGGGASAATAQTGASGTPGVVFIVEYIQS